MTKIMPYHSQVPRQLHHAAIIVADLAASLVFYCDGLGLTPLVDEVFDGPWRELFGGPDEPLRSVFLGDPQRNEAGLVELIYFSGPIPKNTVRSEAQLGFLMLSFWVDITATVERLRRLEVGSDLKVIDMGGAQVARVRDPDGVLIELIPNVLMPSSG